MAIQEEFNELNKNILVLSDKFKKEIIDKKGQLDFIEGQLKNKVSIYKDNENKVKDIDLKISKKNNELNSLTREIEEKKAEKDKYFEIKSDIDELNLKKKTIEESSKQDSYKLNQIKEELKNLNNESNIIKNKKNSLLTEKNALVSEVQVFNKTLKDTKNKIVELEQKYKNIKDKLIEQERANLEIEHKILAKREEFSKEDAKLKDVLRTRETKEKENRILELNKDKLSQELFDIKTKASFEKSKIKQEEDRLQSIKKELLQTIMNNREVIDSKKMAEFMKSINDNTKS